MEAVRDMKVPQLRGELRYDEPMSRHVSWRAGGKAKCYFIPADLDDIVKLLAWLPKDEDILWVGLGSNTLVRDSGFDGTVIALHGVLIDLNRLDHDRVHVGTGVTGAKLARFCAKENLVGAEFFAGIPGLIGGALAMNAGAFGGETWQHVISVETINRKGKLYQRHADEYQVGYRHVSGPTDEWFTAAVFQFEQGNGRAASEAIKQLLAKRAATQPMGAASCGSVFTNPDNDYAARLIEASGLKGYRIGGAAVSDKHANFILNDHNATANDIESLIKHVQTTVLEKQGIKLQTEVRIVGGRT
jgi:UDP-N-acetylmuramate dehydrogenase